MRGENANFKNSETMNNKNEYKASVQVFRAETRLTVYRSPYITRTEGISVRVIRMLVQLVGRFPVERASVLFTKKCMLRMKIIMKSCLRIIKI